MSSINTEAALRLKAIDPKHSYIVQAPAGSGKTELLTQRYLRLLSVVDEPEEVVAITFTRKAASEMRERVLHALEHQTQLQSEHQQFTQSLAQQVLERDQIRNWQLMHNPNRLRILTIDALCVQLANKMPLLSRLAPQAKIRDDARPLYQQAVYDLFNSLNEHSDSHDSLRHLLLAMDNRADMLAELFMDILAQREQWLALLVTHYRHPEALRAQLEEGLKEIIRENLALVSQKLADEYKTELLSLLQYAGTHLVQNYENHALCLWLDLDRFPEASLDYHSHWQALAELLLTQDQNWRKSFDKRQGFPSEAKDKISKENFKKHKEAIKNVIKNLSEDDDLHSHFCDLLNAPSPTYTDEQWSLLKHIIKLLPLLVAELNLIFQAGNSIDFIELNLSALRALGTIENPTDLALYLDYQIKHLLIDEFQDTSLTQFKLIEQLIANWSPEEGKSLFLVGDPMQSIYRFRNAEVGLFLRVQQQGIGSLSLHNIQLNNNFRSDPKIIEWLNQNFSAAFPKHPDITAGAVPYSASIANKITDMQAAVHYYPLINSTAKTVAKIIQKLRRLNANSKIAILVRSRRQLQEIIPILQKTGLKFKAVELDALSSRIEIADLFSLTRALSHLADRAAWLAILRAPWCGLKLADLHVIALHANKKPIWASLMQFHSIPKLSEDARLRLSQCVPIWEQQLARKNHDEYADWIKDTWLKLKGPACLTDENQLKNAESYFELLRTLSHDASFSLSQLHRKLNQLYAEPHPETDDLLQIMTIHKAKGLEFDHVILPHLEAVSPAESTRLLRWLERPRLTKASDLILAPFKTVGIDKEAIYDYLLDTEKQKLAHESLRLLYVAASRSKISLHLLFELELDDENQLKKPDNRSFIYHLWPELVNAIQVEELVRQQQEDQSAAAKPHQPLRRLKTPLSPTTQ